MPLSMRNSDMLDLLQGEYQRKYEPNFALGNAISTCLALPGLRAFWACSTQISGGVLTDNSGNGKVMTLAGAPFYSYDNLAPVISLDGANDWFARGDEADLDILGTETYIRYPGLTLGGWFRPTYGTSTRGLIGKYNSTGNQQAYLIRLSAAGVPGLLISNTGAASVAVNSSVTLVNGRWSFIVGRYTPSTEEAIWVNSTKDTNVVGIPASIFNSTASLLLGAYNAGLVSSRYQGYMSMLFLCASALSDAQITNLFQQTRALYGI